MDIFYLGLIERYGGCHSLSIQACTSDVNALVETGISLQSIQVLGLILV
jgi:hypothetical protein